MNGTVEGLLAALEASPFAVAARTDPWLYPAAEIAHILGIGLLVGAVTPFDLRQIGVTRGLPLAPLARLLLPVSAAGFCLAALSASVLFSAEATAIARNPAFQLKLVLIGVALANVAAFHLRRGALCAEGPRPIDRAQAALSLVVWVAVLACGRLIAYV